MAVTHDQRVLLASAARTTTQTGDWNGNLGHRGATFVLDLTVDAASVELTLSVQGRAANGGIYTVATAAVIDAVGVRTLEIYPGLTDETTPDGAGNDAVPNVFNAVLPPVWRYVVTAADGDSGTYSLAVDLLP